MMEKINFQQFPCNLWIVLFSLILYVPCVMATEKVEAKHIEPITIGNYKKSSFSPMRKESFVIPIHLKTPAEVKSLSVEIYSSDDYLLKTLVLKDIKTNKYDYEIHWNGRDKLNYLVPDEAYFPVIVFTNKKNIEQRIDYRATSGGEEVYNFEKKIRSGAIEYTLPTTSRVLIRSGIKNGPMLRTIIDWEPRSVGFHAERWNGRDLDDIVNIEQNPKVGYLIVGYQLPQHSIITFGNKKESYRAYREKRKLPIKQTQYKNRLLEREGTLIRPEFYTPVLQQKSPRIVVSTIYKKSRLPITTIKGFDEILTKVQLNSLDEIYLDQERYEISFFVDNEFIAEEEQGFVPFTWRWSPGRYGIKPGKHILTVNISGYGGQVGVRNSVFTLMDTLNKTE